MVAVWAAFAVSLPPPPSRLPPGAGNEAKKLEPKKLELGKQGYVGRVGQSNGHAAAVSANGDGGELAATVGLTHGGIRSWCGDVAGLYTSHA